MNTLNFIIEKVDLFNFRGYKKGSFEFFGNNPEKRGIVLIGGANGFGKTSLIDAIEWCLTGTVRRLKREFDARANGEKTLMSQAGILRYALTNEPVKVVLEGRYNGKFMHLERIFNGKAEVDGLHPLNTTLNCTLETTNYSTLQTVDDLEGFNQISNTFYDRYICSYEKNISIYNKSREDIYELFSGFFGGIEEIDHIINNLEGSDKKKDNDGLIKQASALVRDAEVERDYAIKEVNEQKNKLAELASNLKNREEISKTFDEFLKLQQIYDNENQIIDIWNSTELSIDEKIAKITGHRRQVERIKELYSNHSGYLLADKMLKALIPSIKYNEYTKELLLPFNQYQLNVEQARASNETSLSEAQECLSRGEKELKNLKAQGAPNELERIVAEVKRFLHTPEEEIFCADWEKEVHEWKQHNEQKVALSKQLSTFDTLNPTIKALRALVDNIQGFDEYKLRGILECPLCGSAELFSSTEQLAANASKALGEIDLERSQIQDSLSNLEQFLTEKFNSLVERVAAVVSSKASKVADNLYSLKVTQNIRLACLKYNLSFNELTSERVRECEKNFLDELNPDLAEIEHGLLSALDAGDEKLYGVPSIIGDGRTTHSEFIGWEQREKYDQLSKFVENYSNELKQVNLLVDLANIEESDLEKRVCLLSLLENGLSNDLGMKLSHEALEKANSKLQSAQNKINRHQGNFDHLKEISSKTRSLKNEWDRKIAEHINGPIKTIYRKLNRHSNFNEINLKREGRVTQIANLGVQKGDGKSLGIANVLSTGQLSTVALSVFLTVAFSQWKNSFRCYFMDDPIQSMDDLNILSFVDLLRTELGPSRSFERRFADQLFITTCNEDLENLIAHKMKSFGVNICHMRLAGYGVEEKIT